jgi:hypothetical protein
MGYCGRKRGKRTEVKRNEKRSEGVRLGDQNCVEYNESPKASGGCGGRGEGWPAPRKQKANIHCGQTDRKRGVRPGEQNCVEYNDSPNASGGCGWGKAGVGSCLGGEN